MLGNYNYVFENISLKGLFGQNKKKLKILKLSRDSRYLQKLALNIPTISTLIVVRGTRDLRVLLFAPSSPEEKSKMNLKMRREETSQLIPFSTYHI